MGIRRALGGLARMVGRALPLKRDAPFRHFADLPMKRAGLSPSPD